MILTVTNMAALLTETHFDMTVTLGNVLTILAFAVAAIAFGFRLEAKVALHEAWIKAHEECAEKQMEILNKLNSAIAYLRGRNGFHERQDD